jgi:hypothetical protein
MSGRTINYPDGSSLVTSAYTPSPAGGTIGVFLHPILLGMIGASASGYDPNSPLVRFTWPMLGAPYQDLNDDILYVSCVIKDEPYDKIRDVTETTPDGPSAATNIEIWNYTRCWTIRFCAYGPNAEDNLRAVRSAMSQDLFVEMLAVGQLFPIPDSAAPTRTPELHNAQWWERSDLSVDMYEWVTEQITRQTILSAEVITLTFDQATVVPPIYPPPAVIDGGPFIPPGGSGTSVDGGGF